MKSPVLLFLLAGLAFFRAAESALCSDPNAKIDDPCITCECVMDPSEFPPIPKWSCEQTCTECPAHVVMEVCLFDSCPFASCPAYPDATCSYNCTTCEPRHHKDGEPVQCNTGIDCPPELPVTYCFNDPCLWATCPADLMARCEPDYCGGCNYRFLDGDGNEVDCYPGCLSNPCQNGGTCFASSTDISNYICQCMEGFFGPNCERVVYSPCPEGLPFTNCTYDEVCSAPCAAAPNAQCRVDHCGGCTPVYYSVVGHRMNCSTGEVIKCPPGVEEMSCPDDLCDGASCDGDPDASCFISRCGECKMGFVNAAGYHINCTTGEAYMCPPGWMENTSPTAEVCVNATCPANPWAKCHAKKCLKPDKPLACPYEFFDARARPVHCMRDKPGRCPMPDPYEFGPCESECMDDSDCEGYEKCCSNGCGRVCRHPEMGEEEEKPGTCPMPAMGFGGICAETCWHDDDCPDRRKCCSNGCGHSCMYPQEYVGECPRKPNLMMLLSAPQQACTGDSDCSGYRSKCCAYGCGQVCTAPIHLIKEGMCPKPMPDSGGTCEEMCQGDEDCPGNRKCCGNGCGHTCVMPVEEPGACPIVPEDGFGICVEECFGDYDCGMGRKCCSNGCGHVCKEPVPVPPSPCPEGLPYMNCTYDEVCSAPCAAVPNTQCRVDHCGGCNPVYYSVAGHRMNCSTGEVIKCPPGVEEMSCPDDLCDGASCDGDPDASCFISRCGECKTGFVNTEGYHVNCMTGEPLMCPPGWMENTSPTDEVCANATCPTNPWAKCHAKKCLKPNKPLACPYEFFDARARPVHCMKEKYGECPIIDPYDFGTCESECMDDSDCEGYKKCCSNGCGRVCRQPEMGEKEPLDKPGTCPAPYMDDGSVCDDECYAERGDAGCPGHTKCCHNGCGYVCMKPQEMLGECPMPSDDGPGSDCGNRCESDRDCEGPGMKCCSTGCGTRCRKPVTRGEKPGTCPAPTEGFGGICAETCWHDSDCPDRRKCCSNGCGHSCMYPQEYPGECPRKPNLMMLLASPQQACTGDSDCSGYRSKCCTYGCGQICTIPVHVIKDGACPKPMPDSGGTCEEMCQGDEDCLGNRKCCGNGCGHTCIEPVAIPNSCPIVPEDVFGICVEECSADYDCDFGQKCCFNGCGHVCKEPASGMEKQGYCPELPPYSVGPCADMCSRDYECPGNRKCCFNGCGHTCTERETMKQGQCPKVIPYGERVNCMQPTCSSDIDCPGYKKCCDGGCDGNICLPPYNPGMCPDVPDGVVGTCVNRCTSNSDCPMGKMCCSNGCGLVCKKPVQIQCGDEELTDVCDHNPCQEAFCPSHPNAVCIMNPCGGCQAQFYLDGEQVTCTGQSFCRGFTGDDKQYGVGTIVDSSDGCNQWIIIQVTLRFSGAFDNILNRKDMFTARLKKYLSERFGVPVSSLRDFKVRRGSIIVEFKVSSDGTTDVEEAVQMMEMEVESGNLSFEFDGEEYQADRDSFKSNPVGEGPSTSGPPRDKDVLVYIAIGIIGGLVIIVFLAGLIACVVNSKKSKAEKTKSENLEFNDYGDGEINKGYKA